MLWGLKFIPVGTLLRKNNKTVRDLLRALEGGLSRWGVLKLRCHSSLGKSASVWDYDEFENYLFPFSECTYEAVQHVLPWLLFIAWVLLKGKTCLRSGSLGLNPFSSNASSSGTFSLPWLVTSAVTRRLVIQLPVHSSPSCALLVPILLTLVRQAAQYLILRSPLWRFTTYAYIPKQCLVFQ